ncbi:Uncharacterized protein Adt_47469 [Abeliophyllum distichum]|uniref:Uncharacterized protein n=1 Tax=Abeliophyllum distichum TaxID=126358 RepID=A0ABD1NTW7_9LAMI
MQFVSRSSAWYPEKKGNFSCTVISSGEIPSFLHRNLISRLIKLVTTLVPVIVVEAWRKSNRFGEDGLSRYLTFRVPLQTEFQSHEPENMDVWIIEEQIHGSHCLFSSIRSS